jgi:hypothetical protein
MLIKADTYPPLQHLLVNALVDWMKCNDDGMVISPALYHADVKTAILQQNAIGWRQLFSGRFGTEWSRIQDDYYARKRKEGGIKNRRSGSKWQVLVISFVWKQWLDLWKLRNEEIHGRDNTTRMASNTRDIENELRSVYDNRNHFEPRVQELLLRDLQDHLQRPEWVTRNWLCLYGM